MNLFRVLFPKASKLSEAQKRLKRLEADKKELELRNAELWKSYNQAESRCLDAIKKLDDAKEKLREQTDADLLLVSARITQTIIAGKKPAASDVSEQQRLIAQRQGLAQLKYYSSSPYQDGSLLGQLGLGNVFGQYP